MESNHLKDLGVDRSIILKWIFRQLNGWFWARIGTCGRVL
jgi:hypothetical protein